MHMTLRGSICCGEVWRGGVLVDDSVVPIMDIGEILGSGPIGISIGIRYRVPTP